MGSHVEINDTLQITPEQGFPVDVLDYEKHVSKPVKTEDVQDRLLSFHNKPGQRFFQSDPVRVFLVQNISGKWLHWGHILIQSQEITKVLDEQGVWQGDWVTSGTFKILRIYDPNYQKLINKIESPPGKNYLP